MILHAAFIKGTNCLKVASTRLFPVTKQSNCSDHDTEKCSRILKYTKHFNTEQLDLVKVSVSSPLSSTTEQVFARISVFISRKRETHTIQLISLHSLLVSELSS